MEPNPPVRRNEDFPKTTTVPEQWVTDALMDAYNPAVPDPKPEQAPRATPARVNACENVREAYVVTSKPIAEAQEEENPFTRALDPFPTRGEQFGAWL